MANYQLLKADIDKKVYQNGKQEITGANLNSVLNAMVTTLGAGYQFIGMATPTNPGTAQTPDYKCFYISTTPGTYTNMGGLIVADGEVALLKYDSSWTKEVTGIASADKLNQLGQRLGTIIDKQQILSATAGGNYEYIKITNIKQGDKFKVKADSSVGWSRLILTYNGLNANRLADWNDETYKNQWVEFTAPADITWIGFYIVASSIPTIDIAVEIGGLEKQISTVESKTESLEETVGTLSGDIIGLSGEVKELSEKVKSGKAQSELSYEWQQGVWGGDGNYNFENKTYKSTTIQPVHVGAMLICKFPEEARQLRVVGFDENNVFKEIYTGGNITSDTTITIQYPRIAFSETINGSTPITPSWDSGIKLILLDDLQYIKDIKDEIPFIKGKNIVSFGDSIMAGDGNSGKGIVDILKEKYGVSGQDYAVGGSAMQYFEGHGHIPTQIQAQINNNMAAPDVFLLDGLSNDIAYNGSVLGTLTESFDYKTQGYASFVGGMEYAIGLLKENYPQVPVIYMIPHSTPSRVYQAEVNYGEMARAICKKWSVPIIDVYSAGNLNARITFQKSLYCDSGGTHPNQLGYDKFYIPLALSMIKKSLNP